MPKSKFQFTIRRLLASLFWMALCFGTFAAIQNMHRARVASPLEGPLTVVMMILPFFAIGALFGRTMQGAALGIFAIGVFWFLFYLL